MQASGPLSGGKAARRRGERGGTATKLTATVQASAFV